MPARFAQRALLAAAASALAAAAAPALGFVFTSEGWSHPSASFGSSLAAASLRALAATGANTVACVVTAYVDGPAAVVVHGIDAPSPLRTVSPAELAPFLALARELNLSVVIDAVLDINWDLPANARAHAWYAEGATSRAAIGSAIASGDDEAWDSLFASWGAWLRPWMALANATAAPGVAALAALPADVAAAECATLQSLGAGTVAFSLASELDAVWGQEARMRALVVQLRAAFPGGCVTAAFTGASLASVKWLDAVDLIGVDAFWSLNAAVGPLPLGQAPTVSDLILGWAQAVQVMGDASAAAKRPVLVMATGAQSRPNCHLQPWATGAPGGPEGNDQGDESAWPCAYDMHCQANVYASALQVLLPHAATNGGWLAGLLFWRWNADPTAGGTSDADFSPHGKEAEAVFRNASGALEPDCSRDSASGVPSACDGSRGLVAAMQARAADLIAGRAAAVRSPSAAPFTGFRGFVFGGPDEWSSPYYRLDSPGALQSLSNMKSLGANSLELVVQYFFASVNDTTMYAITDPASPMRTSTDAEIATFILQARALGLRVILSPMLDPDWTLRNQLGCRTLARRQQRGLDDPGRDGCYWRGQVGYFWPDAVDSCAASPLWAAWHESYHAFIMHFAQLAQATGADGFIVAHELDRPVNNCAAEWVALLAAVRGAFAGAVSIAQGNGIYSAAAPTLAWIKALSWVGIECYQGGTAPAPAQPWQDAPLADMQAGVERSLEGMAAFAASSGLKIACTEGGWVAAPWASESGWGGMLDLSDSTVHDLDTWGPSQALAYTAMLSVIEAKPYFAGGWWWLWRADPTSGGTSDHSPSPWAKEASAAIAAQWLP